MKSYRLTGEHFYKFFQCPHWIWYDLYGDQTKKGQIPPLIQMLNEDGLKHEKNIVSARHGTGGSASSVAGKFEEIKPELLRDLDEAFAATLELMKQGKNIYHGVLMDQHWVGIPDLLEARPVRDLVSNGTRPVSVFGDYYYVVYDIKSGSEIKDEYKFQLTFYSVILERIQGILPREAFIVNADGEERSFVVDDFLDYFHLTRERIERILDGEKPPPFLKSGCKQSPWYMLCMKETKECRDVSLIYRLSQNDQRRLYDLGIRTIDDIAKTDLNDLQAKLEDWPFDKLMRFQSQAQVLISNEPKILRTNKFPQVKHEIYFDVETDPTEDIDYLLGVLEVNPASHEASQGRAKYKAFLAKDKEDEARNWREFLDFIAELQDFAIYHYSQYEHLVFKRLANRHGISLELENKFKDHTIDLLENVVDSTILPLYFYNLKDVARYLGFAWRSENAGGAESVVWYNEWLKTGDNKTMDKIIKYNEDDVRATLFVKRWLESQKPHTSKEKLD